MTQILWAIPFSVGEGAHDLLLRLIQRMELRLAQLRYRALAFPWDSISDEDEQAMQAELTEEFNQIKDFYS